MTDKKEEKKLIKFEGQVKWATIPPRKARGPGDEYKTDANRNDLAYKIDVEVSEEKFKALKKAGIPKLTQLKEDEETGKTYMTLRASKVKTNPKGDDWEFDDIVAVGPDGKPLTVSVANGSEAIVVASLEPSKKGKVLRLKGVKVTKLIPYEDEGGMKKEVNDMLGVSEEETDDEEASAESYEDMF